MIYGVGTDLVEKKRIKKAIERETFLKRIYTSREQQLIQTDWKKAAGNFATKEAVVKMLGTGFGEIAPNQIEVLRDEAGKPYIVLYEAAKELEERLGLKLHVSITNTKEYASAFVVGEVMS